MRKMNTRIEEVMVVQQQMEPTSIMSFMKGVSHEEIYTHNRIHQYSVTDDICGNKCKPSNADRQ
jgi:hypothetical protein